MVGTEVVIIGKITVIESSGVTNRISFYSYREFLEKFYSIPDDKIYEVECSITFEIESAKFSANVSYYFISGINIKYKIITPPSPLTPTGLPSLHTQEHTFMNEDFCVFPSIVNYALRWKNYIEYVAPYAWDIGWEDSRFNVKYE